MLGIRVYYILSGLFSLANGHGVMIPYKPFDISNECYFSRILRYDLSYGMGLSDTITLVLRTLVESDYECIVEITTEDSYTLMLVIKYPTTIGESCHSNTDMLTLMRKNYCVRICDITKENSRGSQYFAIAVQDRIRFRFLSNSSLNNELNSRFYQITGTSARRTPPHGCNVMNESKCTMPDMHDYCYTNGVVCDGIKNCAQNNWFDERKAECGLPVDRLGFKPVIAVLAVVICATLAAGHLLWRCLPPYAHSFFIFNVNEDNRLCIDPVLQPPETSVFDEVKLKRTSIIPVSSYSSDTPSTSQGNDQPGNIEEEIKNTSLTVPDSNVNMGNTDHRRKIVRSMTAQLQEKLRFVTGRKKSKPPLASHDGTMGYQMYNIL